MYSQTQPVGYLIIDLLINCIIVCVDASNNIANREMKRFIAFKVVA